MSFNCSCHTCHMLAHWDQTAVEEATILSSEQPRYVRMIASRPTSVSSVDDMRSTTSKEQCLHTSSKKNSLQEPSSLPDSMSCLEVSDDCSSNSDSIDLHQVNEVCCQQSQVDGKSINISERTDRKSFQDNCPEMVRNHQQPARHEIKEVPNQCQHQNGVSCYEFPTTHPSHTSQASAASRQEETNDRLRTNSRMNPTNCANRPQNDDQRSPQPTQQATQTRIKKPGKVFVTYAMEKNKRHMQTVIQICNSLIRNGVDTSVDVFERILHSMSSANWLDEGFSTSDFVLVCISPGYRDVVKGISPPTEDEEKEKALHTAYIHRRMHVEYLRNWSKNYRFLPVLCSGAVANHIPDWLRDTKCYKWPQDWMDLFYRLYRIERYPKPKLGPMPVFTVQLYADYNSRNANRERDESHTEPKRVY